MTAQAISPTLKVAFVTKYALTKGILQARVLEVNDHGITVKWKGGYNEKAYFGQGAFAETLEEAHAQVEAARVKKIAALHRQIKRLETLKAKVFSAG